jgi:cell division septation protein DedD
MSKAGFILMIVGASLLSSTAPAQVTVASDPVYRRAQAMVNDGNAAGGRAVVDSMLAQATPGSNEFAEGLYWRAVLASTAAEAESDYRRIIVDHPMSPRIEDVLLRLAQLEVARADYDGALQHLNRLTREHPEGASRARASYWTARVLFEKNDIQRACIANADALARTTEEQAELRNQITYLNQRCAGVSLTPQTAVTAADSTAPRPAAPAVTTGQTAVVQTDSTISRPTTPTTPTTPTAPKVTTPKPTMRPPDKPRDVSPTMLPPRIPVETGTTATTATTRSGYTIQIAAYNVKSQAQAMVTRLKQRGYEARVSGASAPFRVRIGHYASRAQASAVLRSLKAKKIEGIVVQAEAR